MRCPLCDNVARLDEGNDAPRDKAGDLRKAHAQAIAALDHEVLALVLLARLVEIGVEELARNVDDAADRCRRSACGSRARRTPT